MNALSRFKFIQPILSELLLQPDFQRRPEPDLVMERDDQVQGYQEAGHATGPMFAIHLFHAAQIAQTIGGAQTVIDLGCGPATQLALVARLHPETKFIGVDLSAPMLEVAEEHCRSLGLKNVKFMQEDVAALASVPSRSCDAVISTMALHHLPDLKAFAGCFHQVGRILAPNGQVYVADLIRPKRRQTVELLARFSSDAQPKVFNDDYRNSMLAAFEVKDFEMMARHHVPECHVYVTRPLPLFVAVKTRSLPVEPKMRDLLLNVRAALSPRLQRDLDDLRLFFRLGGLVPDVFQRTSIA